MSVVINMPMPNSCVECKLRLGVYCMPTREYIEHGKTRNASCSIICELPDNGDRPSWCPIICQLPEGHGRLVDADEIQREMYHGAFETDTDMQKWDSGCWIRYKMFENTIGDVPTIVPAERSEA